MQFDLTNLKRQIEENPLLAMGVGAAFLTAGSKFLNSVTARQNAKTWKREVDRRTKKSK